MCYRFRKTHRNQLTLNTCTKSRRDHFLVVYFGKCVRKKAPFSYIIATFIPLKTKTITSNR